MAGQIDVYSVHTHNGPFLIVLFIGWLCLFAGTLRYGQRFALFALPFGTLVPLSVLLFFAHNIWNVFDPEAMEWVAAFWLLPGALLTGLALLIKRLFSKPRP